MFKPNHPLPKQGNDFLDHDSYVELQQIVEHRESDIEEAVVIGALSDDAVNLLCEAVRSARTLTEDHKELIIRRLRDEIPF